MRTLLAIASFTLCLAAHAQVIYVDVDATGANNGTSWTDAYTDLQDALVGASSGDEIWVAEGIYKPTTTTDRTVSFVLIDGVALYGGFDGTETSRDERDWTKHESVLSGDIGISDDDDDNSYHVVEALGLTGDTRLDGLYLQHGTANSDTYPYGRGGGIYAVESNLGVYNCTMWQNRANSGEGQLGGAMYVEGGLVEIEDSRFEENIGGGGGVYVTSAEAAIARTVFSNNTGSGAAAFFDTNADVLVEDVVFENTDSGSVVLIVDSTPTFRGVIFRNNTGCSGCDGGAVFITDGAAPVFEDCLFENNQTGLRGGAVFSLGSTPLFISSTFRNNSSGSSGAIYLNNSTLPILIQGCHFERNRALDGSSSAVFLVAAHGLIANSTFIGNGYSSAGTLSLGGLSSSGQTIVANSLIAGNRSELGGGLRLVDNGTANIQIVNTVIAFNDAVTEGGGVYSRDFGAPFTEAQFENVIVWGNTAPEGANIYWEDFDSGPPEVTRSIVGGGYEWGTDILDVDPLFVRNPDPGPDMTWGTDDDDYGDLRLRMGSPGIDYGLEAFLPADIWDLDGDGNTTEPLPIDLNGDPRVLKTEVDLGPYEGAVFVSNEQEVPEAGFALSVFPNPSREAADLHFRPARPSHINIAVFDLLGRQVAVLADERFDAGSYQRVFDGRELPSGTYVIRAHVVPQDGSAPQTHTQRLTLLK